MYRIRITTSAKKELKKLNRSNFLSIGCIFEDLKEDPYMGKKLTRELKNRYVYRIGVYRIVYKILEKECVVEVISAGHRAKAYQ